ncbi:MAG: hypothetical protein DWP97_03070 [Calditrichaeota bacterium]|nr:MAG: hypothetical protein DWP97_03070 [Calditrichota bacterium]
MRLNLTKLFSILIILSFLPMTGFAGVDAGISIDENGISDFHLAISKHYKVEEKEIVVIQKKNIPEEEIPVVFYLAKHLGVESSRIVKLRLDGLTWHEICKFYGISPELFFVELKQKPGPPYGRAYGKYHKRPQRNWREIYLSDADIINWTNLKFASEYYNCDPELIVEMRSNGRGFSEIHNAVKQNIKSDKKQAKADKDKSEKKNKGKSQKK